MIPGQRVSHPAFGPGVVIAVNITGPRKQAHVAFGYTKAWIVLDQLEVIGEPEAPPISSTPSSSAEQPVHTSHTAPDTTPLQDTPTHVAPSIPMLRDSQTEARKAVLALRLGQILESQCLALSVGTEALQERLEHALARALNGTPTFVMIDGVWGGGKTHALTILQALARNAHVATSSAVMDGVGVTMSEPMQLMETIVGTLHIPGSGADVGLGQLIRNAKLVVKTSSLRARGAREIAEALESFPPQPFDDPEALQCIEDYFAFALSTSQVRDKLRSLGYESPAPPVLRSRWLADRPRAFANLLKCWAQTLAVMGSRGLLVVLDELDVEYASTIAANQSTLRLRARRRALLEQLTSLSTHDAPLLVAFASAPAPRELNIEHDAVEDVCTMIGKTMIRIKAATPTESDLKQLLSRLAALYETAYPETPLRLGIRQQADLFTGLYIRYLRAPNPVPRHFVRTTLEAFDLIAVGSRTFEGVLEELGVSN